MTPASNLHSHPPASRAKAWHLLEVGRSCLATDQQSPTRKVRGHDAREQAFVQHPDPERGDVHEEVGLRPLNSPLNPYALQRGLGFRV